MVGSVCHKTNKTNQNRGFEVSAPSVLIGFLVSSLSAVDSSFWLILLVVFVVPRVLHLSARGARLVPSPLTVRLTTNIGFKVDWFYCGSFVVLSFFRLPDVVLWLRIMSMSFATSAMLITLSPFTLAALSMK